MTFPTIPTAGAGRVLTATQADTSATRTFPNLSSLTKNSGDLLIAIIVAYQSSVTDAAFSAWGGGFTEFHDTSTSTTMAIGIAYKWSDGTETGTFTVTQAATITGHAAMTLLSIPGAHLTTPPEAGSRASGTTAAADPGAFDPAGWGAEDTLWIAIAGSGENATGGAYTGVASAPANYSNYADTGITADVVGGCEGAVAFRQLNAASEDVGTFSVDVSNARNAAVVVAIRPVPVTGTGALTSQNSVVSGTGVSRSLSTDGAIAAQDSTASGTGTVSTPSITGTGTLVSQASDVSGVGLSRSFSTDGAITAQDADVSGAGLSRSFSTDGAITAQDSDVTGAGLSRSLSTDGAIAAQDSDVSGTGTVSTPPITGTGTLVSQSADITGAGKSSSIAFGDLVVDAATLAAIGASRSLGTGGLVVGSANVTGSGIVANPGGEVFPPVPEITVLLTVQEKEITVTTR